jgi:hypothetical protein
MNLTFDQVAEIWDDIMVCATDGNKYPLKEYYPILLRVKDQPDWIYLDTGGQMMDCDFLEARIEDNKLMRLNIIDNNWYKIATLDYPDVNKKEINK